MSLRIAVAAPFKQHGSRTIRENQFVVALSLDRDWFSPDQAKRLIDVATGRGLLERDGDDVRLTVDPADVDVPSAFVPDEALLRERSAFERLLEAVVTDGQPKHETVGTINAIQQEFAITIEAAAIVYARREGIDVTGLTGPARAAVIDD